MDTGEGEGEGWKESSLPALGWGGRRAGILEDHAREGPLRVGARRVTRGDEWSLWLRGTPRRGPPVLSSPTANLGGRHICVWDSGDCLVLTGPPTPAEGVSDFTG